MFKIELTVSPSLADVAVLREESSTVEFIMIMIVVEVTLRLENSDVGSARRLHQRHSLLGLYKHWVSI